MLVDFFVVVCDEFGCQCYVEVVMLFVFYVVLLVIQFNVLQCYYGEVLCCVGWLYEGIEVLMKVLVLKVDDLDVYLQFGFVLQIL